MLSDNKNNFHDLLKTTLNILRYLLFLLSHNKMVKKELYS